jgi:hypothetical protein
VLEYVQLPVPTEECSVELTFDFVDSSVRASGKSLLVECGGRRL